MPDTIAAPAADTTTAVATETGASTGAPVVASGTAAAAPASAAASPPAGTVLTDPPAAGEAPKTEEAAKPAAPAVPEKYELKLPETPTLDQAALDRTAAFARERGLSQEAAQAALDLANTEAKAAVDAVNQRLITDYSPGDPAKNIAPGSEWTKMQTEWRAQSLAHPEIGNGKPEQFEAMTKLATRAFEKYTSPGFREVLRSTGYGSHPEMVLTFAKIGAAMAEGSFVAAEAQSGGRMSDADVFYGKKD